MLNIPVRIPDAEELSGIGAAWAAGLAVGLYGPQVFGQLKRVSFLPILTEKDRNIMYQGWFSAVRMVRTNES